MLPRLIKDHPYFHENVDLDLAKRMVEATPVSQGSFLFCYDSQDNENSFALVCKGKHGDELNLRVYHCIYHPDLFGTKIEYMGFGSPFSGLDEIVRYIARWREPYRGLIPGFRDFILTPIPIFNPMYLSKLDSDYNQDIMSPLPNDTVELIAQHLDLPALTAVARVSRSWNTLFGKNLLMIFRKKEMIQAEIIKADQEERMYSLMYRFDHDSHLE